MKTVITILDGITETSMPFNEFVLYRANHYAEERQILIVCGEKCELPQVDLPDSLEILFAKRKLFAIRKTIRKVTADLKSKGIPYIIHMHQVKSAFLTEMAMLGTGFRKKTLFTIHSTFSGYKFHNKVLSFVNAVMARYSNCVSEAAYNDYPRIVKRIKRSRFTMIRNGVDTERIDSVIPDEKDSGSIVEFIYVARIIPIKNHNFLLNVLMKCNSNIHFTFVGAEDEGKVVRKQAAELGLSNRITFTGIVPRVKVFEMLKQADFYMSSSTLEGLPVSVLEAMYCGLPCILSDIPQHKEVAGEGVILLPFDIDKWSTEINRLSMLQLQERVPLSARIKEYAESNFGLSRMHEQYDEVYECLR